MATLIPPGASEQEPFDGTLANPGLMRWEQDPKDDKSDQDRSALDNDSWENLLAQKCSGLIPPDSPALTPPAPPAEPEPFPAPAPRRGALRTEHSPAAPDIGGVSRPSAASPALPKCPLIGPDATVLQAINYAAKNANVEPATFYCLVKQESGFRTSVKASTSSATGLCQFVDSTWLATIKRHGAECGLDKYADELSHGATAEQKQQILALRNDPRISTMMGAYFAHDNQEYLKAHGIAITATSTYMAHFLGAGGAVKLMQNLNVPAADVPGMASAAAANHSIFYDRSGNARTGQQIYDHFHNSVFSDHNMAYASASLNGGSAVQVAANASPPKGPAAHPDHRSLAAASDHTPTSGAKGAVQVASAAPSAFNKIASFFS